MVKFKRIISLVLTLVFVVCLFVLPVSATGESTSRKYAVIPFTTVSFGSNFQYYTEFSGLVVDSNGGYQTVDSENMTQIVSVGENYDVDLYAIPGTRDIRFKATDFVLNVNQFDHLDITFGNDEYSGTVIFNATIVTVVPMGNSYVTVDHVISSIIQVRSGENFYRQILDKIGSQASSQYVYFKHFTLTCSTKADVADGYFRIVGDVASQLPSTSNWFNQLLLKHTTNVVVDAANPDDVSFVDWLAVALGSFLEFELWPGFSLNQLFEFVVVIGLLFWFITLLI